MLDTPLLHPFHGSKACFVPVQVEQVGYEVGFKIFVVLMNRVAASKYEMQLNFAK
jgi:hypothetical protein